MPENASSLTHLLDESAIRDATARFADTLIRADYDGFRLLWSEDAEWVIGGKEGQPFERRAKGVDDIVALFRDLWVGNEYFIHFAIQGTIEIDGDEATTHCVCHEAASGPNGRYYRTNGVWSDHLKRSGDKWVFTSRSYRYLWLDLSPFTGDAFSIHPATP